LLWGISFHPEKVHICPQNQPVNLFDFRLVTVPGNFGLLKKVKMANLSPPLINRAVLFIERETLLAQQHEIPHFNKIIKHQKQNTGT
jgi:hypothetical protein